VQFVAPPPRIADLQMPAWDLRSYSSHSQPSHRLDRHRGRHACPDAVCAAYLPIQEPPWIEPPPPAPPAPSEPPRRRRGRATAILVAFVAVVSAASDSSSAGALFGSPATSSTNATPTANTATLPTVARRPDDRWRRRWPECRRHRGQRSIRPIVNVRTTLANGQAAGTGMILTSNGLVLTNNHVIADANDIRVQVGNGPIYSATVLATDVH